MSRCIKSLLVLVIISFCLFSCDILSKQVTIPEKYEAETARLDGLERMSDSTASAGKYLKLGDKGSVVWDIKIDSAAWYDLVIRYRSPYGEKEQVLIRNGYEKRIGIGYEADWNNLLTQTFLQRGLNTIEVKESWGNIDIDYLTLQFINPKQTLKPKQNTFYKKSPAYVSLKINRFGHKIKKIVCENKEIPFSITAFPFQEDAVHITISKDVLSQFSVGLHALTTNQASAE